jgi:hypothetical protein
LIAQQAQIALVGVKRMHMRIRRDDDGAIDIGRAQGLVFRPIEGKIDQPIVDEIDRLPVRQQPSTLVAKHAAIGDHRVDAMLLKEPLRQEKFRIEVLLGRPLIDDCDASGRADFTLK